MARIVQPTPDAIAEAAEILRSGGLVAFATETVYGLGANALDSDAVRQIFDAKGRPATNPVIVHVGSLDDARKLAEFSPTAEALAYEFWPGPLTLVLPKKAIIPDIVTAGGLTVGIRIPRHPVALALLAAYGLPIAAPSANRSEEISPTLARHVADSLGDAIDMILDGGPCDVGIESTVLDVTVTPPRILRPGTISDLVGQRWERDSDSKPSSEVPSRSPGNLARHYAPRVPLRLVDADDFWRTADSALPAIPLLAYDGRDAGDFRGRSVTILPSEPEAYAAHLYAALRRADKTAQQNGAPYILAQAPPAGREWDAVRDRLTRAAR